MSGITQYAVSAAKSPALQWMRAIERAIARNAEGIHIKPETMQHGSNAPALHPLWGASPNSGTTDACGSAFDSGKCFASSWESGDVFLTVPQAPPMSSEPAMNRLDLCPATGYAPPLMRAMHAAVDVHPPGPTLAADDVRKRDEFARWALPHMDLVYTASLYLTHSRDEAEDLLQETYLRAYRFWHQFTPGTNCKAWLITILHNNFNDRYRHRYRDQQAVEFDEELYSGNAAAEATPNDPETLVLSHLLDEEVEDALRTLPLEFLEVVILVDIHELTYEEAAAGLGCPIGTIRSRLSRGRRLLHAALQGYANERRWRDDRHQTLRQPP